MSEPAWRSKLSDSLLSALAIAIAARVVWEALAPLVPVLLALVVVGALATWLTRRH